MTRLAPVLAALGLALAAASASAQTATSVPALEWSGGSSTPSGYSQANLLWASGTVAGVTGTVQWPYTSLWLGASQVGMANGLPIVPATGATFAATESGT